MLDILQRETESHIRTVEQVKQFQDRVAEQFQRRRLTQAMIDGDARFNADIEPMNKRSPRWLFWRASKKD